MESLNIVELYSYLETENKDKKHNNKLWRIMDTKKETNYDLEINIPKSIMNQENFESHITFFHNSKEKKMTTDKVKEYFKKVIDMRISVTNDTISSTIITECNKVMFQDFITERCENCDTYSYDHYVVKCSDPTNSGNNKNIIFCENCYNDKIIDNCQSHEKILKRSPNFQKIVIICDMCKKQFDIKNRNEMIWSSPNFEVDICTECGKTEKGLDIIKKYNMIETPIIAVRAHFGFGSIYDWIPFFKETDKENYIAMCISKNNINYKRIAIICKNKYNCYEYTIVLKELLELDLNDLIKSDLNKLSNKYHDYTKAYPYINKRSPNREDKAYHDDTTDINNSYTYGLSVYADDGWKFNPNHNYQYRLNSLFPPLTIDTIPNKKIVGFRQAIDLNNL